MSDKYTMDDIDSMLSVLPFPEITGWQKRLLLQVLNHPERLEVRARYSRTPSINIQPGDAVRILNNPEDPLRGSFPEGA